MAALVRGREISPVELVRAHLRQIEAVNPRINAFVSVLAEDALASARHAERNEPLGPLHGVPVTIKDSFDVAGQPTLCGSRLRVGHRAAFDSAAVARLRAAGAIILGKTNVAENLNSYETDNFITGVTRNPWDLARTAGGSSGGEGAAIAAYCSAGGLASDGGGSIRVPAHFCGIAGLKTTPGRISGVGHVPSMTHPGGMLCVAGPMARSVDDLRVLFDALEGYDPSDPFAAPVPRRTADLAGLQVGLCTEAFGIPVDPEIRAAVDAAAAMLREIGIPVATVDPPGLKRAHKVWWFFFAQLTAPFARQLIQGREQDAHWTATELMQLASGAPSPKAEDVVINFAARDQIRARLLRFMQDCPVLLAPISGVTAFRHRDRSFDVVQSMATVTPFNLLGLPALAVPFRLSSEGLPIGIQLVGCPYEEELLLELGVRLEEMKPSLIPALPTT